MNLARFQFLARAESAAFYRDRPIVLDDSVATLHASLGRRPGDRALRQVLDDLEAESEEFRTRWRRYEVRRHDVGSTVFLHPLAGELTLDYQAAELAADPGLTLIIYSAAAGSPTHRGLRLLAEHAVSPAASRSSVALDA